MNEIQIRKKNYEKGFADGYKKGLKEGKIEAKDMWRLEILRLLKNKQEKI